MEKKDEGYNKAQVHVLVLPYPNHGHLNPILQFAKRLTSRGLKVTLAPTHYMAKSLHIDAGPVAIDPISDGCDEHGYRNVDGTQAYIERFQTVGSQTLAQLIEKHRHSSNSLCCLVYDPFLPWALDVAQRFGLRCAAFFTQSCCVDAIYYHVHCGQLAIPVTATSIKLPAMPTLQVSELPSLVSKPESYPGVLELLVSQFSNLERVDWVLINTFDDLEDEVVRWMAKIWPCKAIGPTLPSTYLDQTIEGDTNYGITLFDLQNADCMKWLNPKETGSVVYISFGSIAAMVPEQMDELAWGIKGCNYNFLWVVRESEEDKLRNKFKEETQDKGLIVKWCPQLEVLAHPAIGCFVTHCGWNSTLEALSLGVPLVGVPQWTDQPTNAKYVEEVWGVGLRPSVDEKGIVGRIEMEHCIREVMEGERGRDIKRNACKWKMSAKEAMSPGGGSYTNIEEFVTTLSTLAIEY
ncbi:hypothetical protein AAC387_Pa02g0096 [Persea americana]